MSILGERFTILTNPSDSYQCRTMTVPRSSLCIRIRAAASRKQRNKRSWIEESQDRCNLSGFNLKDFSDGYRAALCRHHVIHNADTLVVSKNPARTDFLYDWAETATGLNQVVGPLKCIKRPLEVEIVGEIGAGTRIVLLRPEFKVVLHRFEGWIFCHVFVLLFFSRARSSPQNGSADEDHSCDHGGNTADSN